MKRRRLPVITERALADVKSLQIENGQSFVMQLHQNGTTTTCKKGCNSCCLHPFLISIGEGVLLYRWLRDNKKWTPDLRAQFVRVRNQVLGVPIDTWLRGNVPCPILDVKTGECSAYEARPFRCRSMYSTGAPTLCSPNALGPRTPLVDNVDAIKDFTRKSLAALKRAGVRDNNLMPLPEAVLLGEAIDAGELDIKDSALQHLTDIMNDVNGNGQ